MDLFHQRAGSYDVWIVKISSNGIIQWQYSYGGSGSDGANDIVRDFNGNYYLIGNTNSGDFDINNPKGAGDILVMKTDSLGILQWSKCLGGSQNEEGQAGCLTTNGVASPISKPWLCCCFVKFCLEVLGEEAEVVNLVEDGRTNGAK